jgi:hypothetical protein
MITFDIGHYKNPFFISGDKTREGAGGYQYCDMHVVGQQSTVETLFITVAKQRNNGRYQRFLCGPFR